jgi:photosystem II stability/assembly factor-like uncharacterized protein
MNDQETRVRARLHEYADAVVPRSDIPAAGRARYRRRVRRQRASAVLAGVLVVVGASGLGVELARRPSQPVQFGTHGGSTTGSSSSTTEWTPITARPGAVISGRPVSDTTWISDDVGWALVDVGILHTTDGGRTWTYVAPTPVPVGTGVTKIRFADARHGWLFGDSFFTTDDGGRTWMPGGNIRIAALEVARGRAYRLVADGDGCPGPCDYLLQTVAVGDASWQSVATPAIGAGTSVQLLYDVPRLYVVTYQSAMGSTERRLVRSVDAGATWQRQPNPCSAGTDDLLVQLATAPGGFVAALCRHGAGGTYIRTSSDAAATFGAVRSLPEPFSGPGAGGVAIAAGASGTIVVAGQDIDAQPQEIHVATSRDVGASWVETLTVPVQGDDTVTFLGFEDAQTGRFAVTGERLWTTRDGGETWTIGRP